MATDTVGPSLWTGPSTDPQSNSSSTSKILLDNVNYVEPKPLIKAENTEPLALNASEPIFVSVLPTTERAANFEWAKLASDFTFDFARIMKAEHGQNLVSSVTVAYPADIRSPLKTENGPNDSPISSAQVSTSSRTREHFVSCVSASVQNTSTPHPKNQRAGRKGVPASLEDKLEWLLPSNLTELLLEDNKRCVTTNQNKKRCARKARRQSTAITQSKLGTVEGDMSQESLLRLVRNLLAQDLCSQHMNIRLPVLAEVCQGVSSMPDDQAGILCRWITAVTSTSAPDRQDCCRTERDETGRESRKSAVKKSETPLAAVLKKDPALRTSIVRSSSDDAVTPISLAPISISGPNCARQWVPHRPNAALSPTKLIETLLLRDLKPSEQAPGYIYMYWRPGDFGYLKIGRTKGLPEKRFKRWEKQCKCLVEDANRHSRYVQHVALVEKLIQAELRDRRVKEVNCVCGIFHVEWFTITPAQAHKVLDKFAEYTDRRSSVISNNRSAEQGAMCTRLSAEDRSRLCQLVDISSPAMEVGPKRNNQRRSTKGRPSIRKWPNWSPPRSSI